MIPKIIHQLWIGDKPPPLEMMDTWKNKHPDFEYIFWNENEIQRRNLQFRCLDKINIVSEINGKADVMRWEILYEYGGIFIDADSICIEKLDDDVFFQPHIRGFASFENENCRKGLIATGTMGFVPKHPLCRDIIQYFINDDKKMKYQILKAWYTVGPGVLTKFMETNMYPDVVIFPSYFFQPQHFTGIKYEGHRKIYALQEWFSSDHTITNNFTDPVDWVSVLISSFNTAEQHIEECLDSISRQIGNFGIELVWLNDGSDEKHTEMLERQLSKFEKNTRLTKLVYKKFEQNIGLYESLTVGVELCSSEILLENGKRETIIFRMDSDDIMFDYRISSQLKFMKSNPQAFISSVGIGFIDQNLYTGLNKKIILHPPVITLSDFLQTRPSWFMNGPGLCFYKSAVLNVGNYNRTVYHKNWMEDYALELRFLKHYGAIYNIQEQLIYYRIHENQLSQKHYAETEQLKNRMIFDILGR